MIQYFLPMDREYYKGRDGQCSASQARSGHFRTGGIAVPTSLSISLAALRDPMNVLYAKDVWWTSNGGSKRPCTNAMAKAMGPITALTFVLTLDHPARFASRDVGPFFRIKAEEQAERGQ
jgi:hypothetical protein